MNHRTSNLTMHKVSHLSDDMNKYLNLAWELKRLWNMKVTVIVIAVSLHGIVLKSLENRLGELEFRSRIGGPLDRNTVKIARIFRKVLETRSNLLSLRVQWKTTWYEELALSENNNKQCKIKIHLVPTQKAKSVEILQKIFFSQRVW